MLVASVLLVLGLTASASADGDSVLVSSLGTATHNASVQSGKPDVYSLHITSHIRYRYASTVVSSRVANPDSRAQEVFFSFVIPETAFISGFLMEIDGVVYKAHVKEKEEAKRDYQAAVSQGIAAAHVAQSARNSNRFKVSVNIEAQQKVTFNLTYEELLKRELSFYKHAINVDPGQIVPDLSVEVFINESSPIKTLQLPVLRESNEINSEEYSQGDPYAEIEVSDHNSATVRWAPTVEQQRTLRADGVKGQLAVRYDLDRSSSSEQILVNEGYFVHFFSPEDLEPLPKHVVFVIDVSGSMWGRKIEQLRDAMTRIISDLAPADFFSFVTFSTDVKVWDVDHHLAVQHSSSYSEIIEDSSELRNSSVVAATHDNVVKAKEFISRLDTYSSTNIHGALMKALKVARLGTQLTQGKNEPMIIFLTDGDANVGESDPDRIVATVSDENVAGVVVFSLAFGDYADMSFLRKLSLKNSGFARKIYEASDAAMQLRDFYRQVASPLLANVTFKYADNQVDEVSLSTTKFSTLYRGSELVVAGKLMSDNVTGLVSARGLNGTVLIECHLPMYVEHLRQNSSSASFMERLWAYLTIQQLLERQTAGSGNSSVIRQKALELALRYSFVTPLTSLVVVKPNETSSVDTEKGDSDTAADVAGSSLVPYPRGPLQQHVWPLIAVPAALGSSPPGSMQIPSDIVSYEALDTMMLETAQTTPATGLHVVPIDRLLWINTTSYSVTLQEDPASSPVTLLLKTANETNEAFSACNTTLGGAGHCRHLVHCALDVFQFSVSSYYPFFCRIDNYAGVCCPDSLQPVVVQS